MAFFNKIGDTLSSVGKDVAKKAKDLTDSTKYTSQIASEEHKITALYQAIGKEYFNEYGTDESAPYADYISEIKQHIAKIEELKKLLQELKGVTLCPVCNKEIPSAAIFCPSCGASICVPAEEENSKEDSSINSESVQNSESTDKAKDPTIESEKFFCPNCGHSCSKNSKFCTSCGAKLAQ